MESYIVGLILNQLRIALNWQRFILTFAWKYIKRVIPAKTSKGTTTEMHNQNCCYRTCHSVGKEFKREKLSLKHEPVDDFFKSQWQNHTRSLLWLLYRWSLAVCFTVGVLGSLIQQTSNGKWFIYLTNWGFLICMLTSCFGAILTTIYHYNPKKFSGSTSVLRFYWGTYTTNLLLAPLISFIYWIFIFPNDNSNAEDLYNLWAHGFNTILMLLDFLLVAIPFHILHVTHPISLGIMYALFSLIYYFAEGTDPSGNPYIYEILDWSKPGWATLLIFGCLLIVFIFSFLIFGLYKLRCLVYKNLRNSVLVIHDNA